MPGTLNHEDADAEARARIRVFLPPITLIVVALPMLLNLVPRNSLYGVRTRETMSSDAAWAAGNRMGAVAVITASAVWLLAAMYAPRRYVKPIGIAAVVLATAILFAVEGRSF